MSLLFYPEWSFKFYTHHWQHTNGFIIITSSQDLNVNENRKVTRFDLFLNASQSDIRVCSLLSSFWLMY